MAIVNPYVLNPNGNQSHDASAWDKLFIGDSWAMAPFPGLVVSATPTLEIELEKKIYNTEASKDSVALPDANFFRTTTVRQYYSDNPVRKPKTVNFTILIYTADDFGRFTKLAKIIESKLGASWQISHPITDLWQFNKEVIITNINCSLPNMENGWEVNISFTEKNDYPVETETKKGWSDLEEARFVAEENVKQAKEKADAEARKKPKGTTPNNAPTQRKG